MTRDIYVFAGLPASGVNTAAKYATALSDKPMTAFDMTEFVGADFWSDRIDSDDQIVENISTESLYSWAEYQIDTKGRDYFGRRLADTLESNAAPSMAIAGIVTVEDIAAIKNRLDGNVTTVGVWTLPDTRYERMYGKVPSEDDEQWERFNDITEQMVWDHGLVEVFSDESLKTADHVITNHGCRDTFEGQVRHVINGHTDRVADNAFLDNDFEAVAEYL